MQAAPKAPVEHTVPVVSDWDKDCDICEQNKGREKY
jgi:hypothetical protein